MTRTVTDNALLLEVIVGPDGYDPRQYAPWVQSYTDGLTRGVHGMRIAIVRAALATPNRSALWTRRCDKGRSCSKS